MFFQKVTFRVKPKIHISKTQVRPTPKISVSSTRILKLRKSTMQFSIDITDAVYYNIWPLKLHIYFQFVNNYKRCSTLSLFFCFESVFRKLERTLITFFKRVKTTQKTKEHLVSF